MNHPIPAVPAFLGLLIAVTTANAVDTLHTQPMSPGGGVTRTSSLWLDPSGQNDSDTDSIAWASFTLAQAGEVTQVRWWGQTPPANGFRIRFENQDPNTVASQPDIFRAGAEHITSEVFPTVAAVPAGSGMYLMTAQLATPFHLEAGTRYFVSVVGRTPAPYPNWSWAQSPTGSSTFWWIRGAHMYFGLGDARAFELLGVLDATPPCNEADLAPNFGTLDIFDILAFLDLWNNNAAQGDYDHNGSITVFDILAYLTDWNAGCP